MRATAVLFRSLDTFKVHDGHTTVNIRKYASEFRSPAVQSQVTSVELNIRVVRPIWHTMTNILPTFTSVRSLKIRRANKDTWDTIRQLPHICPWMGQLTTLHLDECNWPTLEMLTNILRGFSHLDRLILNEQSWKQTLFNRTRRPPGLPNVRELVLQGVTEMRNPRRGGILPQNKGGPHVLDWLAGNPINWAPRALELGWEDCYVRQEAEIQKILGLLGKNVQHLTILPPSRLNKTTLSPKTVNIKEFTQLRTLTFSQLNWDDLVPALETISGNTLTDLHLHFSDDLTTQKTGAALLANVDNALSCNGLRHLKTLHLQLPSFWRGKEFEQTVREWMPQASERGLLSVYQAAQELDLQGRTCTQSKLTESSSPTPRPNTVPESPVDHAKEPPATS